MAGYLPSIEGSEMHSQNQRVSSIYLFIYLFIFLARKKQIDFYLLKIARMQLLVMCYDNKMVKSPGFLSLESPSCG